jgi:hypothetical protein
VATAVLIYCRAVPMHNAADVLRKPTGPGERSAFLFLTTLSRSGLMVVRPQAIFLPRATGRGTGSLYRCRYDRGRLPGRIREVW